MMSLIRIGIGISKESYKKLQLCAKNLDTSQSKLVESLLMMSEEEIRTQVLKYEKTIQAVVERDKAYRKDIRKKIDSLSAEQLAKLLETIDVG